MKSSTLKTLGVAAGLMLYSQALAQPLPGDGWVNNISAVSPSPDNPYEEAVAEHASSLTYEGMGGPVEERTGYPPCSPAPSEDNCIQLYERGVTGLGN